METVEETLSRQSGVISRRQALAGGLTPTDLARLVRRRTWVALHPGVLVTHTGEPTWLQRAWAAVLWAAPAALTHESALRAWEGPGRRGGAGGPIHVAIERRRHLPDQPGVRLHRIARFDERVEHSTGPPRTRYDDTVLDLAAGARTDLDAVARLADACGGRRTNARRMLDALAAQPRIERRAWLLDVLADVARGTCSVLEHAYLDRVVGPHGLPEGRLRALHVTSQGLVVRDVEHDDLALVVQLDGRLFHPSAAARDRDLERDLDAAVLQRATTVRLSLGLGQVHQRACSTAARIGLLMRHRGWTGALHTCPTCPARLDTRERTAG